MRYGDPLTAVRMPAGMLAAARKYAAEQDTSLSGLVRWLIDDELRRAGIDWKQTEEAIEEQMRVEEVIETPA